MIDELTFWVLVALLAFLIVFVFAPASMSGRISRQEDEWPEIDAASLHDHDHYR